MDNFKYLVTYLKLNRENGGLSDFTEKLEFKLCFKGRRLEKHKSIRDKESNLIL
jgi:hypothetical protein